MLSKLALVPGVHYFFWAAHHSATQHALFFAHPLRVLNDIFDPSKATSARPRKQPAFARSTHKRWPQARQPTASDTVLLR